MSRCGSNSAVSLRRRRWGGVSLIELICVTAVIMILASVAIPMASTVVRRQKELELRQALRLMRSKIDRFQLDTERYPGIRSGLLNTVNEEGYPEELEWLYEGVDIGDAAGTKLKYLRRLPLDPMTGEPEWDTRSSRDSPDTLFSDKTNIFDVRSKSEAVGLNGDPYNQW